MTTTANTVERVEELTVRFLDGEAGPAERDELADLVAADGEARRIDLGIIEVEVALRGGRPAPVAEAVLEQVSRERAERAVRGVMQQVSSMTPLARGPRATRRRWPAALAAASIAAALAGVWWWRAPAPPTTAQAPGRGQRTVGRLGVSPPAAGGSIPAGAINVMSLDFEDGALPGLVDGAPAQGDCGPGSRRCLAGTTSEYDPDHNTITLERYQPPLFSYAPDQVLSFDYRVGAEATSLRVQVWSRDRRANFRLVLEDLVRDRWMHAEVRLADLRGYEARGPLEPGDAISNVMFTAGRRDDQPPFHVDNLKVTAYPGEASLPPTSATIPLEP